MAIEVSSSTICSKCGRAYGRRKGYFPVNYSILYKGIGFLNVCKECVDQMYDTYLEQCKDAKAAVRQMCRKLDLYWSENVFNIIEKKNTSRTMMTSYLSKINSITFVGKCYDNTLAEEGTLWSFSNNQIVIEQPVVQNAGEQDDAEPDTMTGKVDPDVINFWGSGMTAAMYMELESRKAWYLGKLQVENMDNLDVGTQAAIRQICNLEVDIARERSAGKPVHNQINTLNSLLGSTLLKPDQKKNDIDSATANTPFGVWIKKWEDMRPVPEPDPELKDVDGIIRYITIWFLGHLCKMLGIRNSYCKLYEEEIAKMRIDKPEYEDEDDETVFNDIFGQSGEEGK